MNDETVDTILGHHGLRSPWQQLPATGIANQIYATHDVVLRIARHGQEAIDDARTESVAAPVARAAGVMVPRLIAFDDSRVLIDRPYSIWERVHGETVGQFAPDPRRCATMWEAVGSQLALLHHTVEECPDPNGWLDHPGRDLNLDKRIAALASSSTITSDVASRIGRSVEALQPAIEGALPSCFLHNDVHAMNLMCSRDFHLLAVLDWGDAGWGDPALEFAQIPLAAMPFVLHGYRSEATLDKGAAARVRWDKLCAAIEDVEAGHIQGAVLEHLVGSIAEIV